MRRFRGVLLDVDGTLVDSNDAHARAWVEALAEHGVQVPFENVRRLIGMGGEKKLTELKWKSAASQWGSVQVDRNAGGQPLRIDGKGVSYGIGTHANSLIVFDMPPGYTRFKARGGMDNGGTDQGNPAPSSVRFMVFTEPPPAVHSMTPSGQ